MSHEIGEKDKQQGTFMAWHGLTEILAVITLAKCWLAEWDVLKRPLFRLLADGTKETSDACEVVCTDDENLRIGSTVDCESYTLLTNKKFLEIVQSAMDSIRGAAVASVGSLKNRARIFVSLSLPSNMETIANAGSTLAIEAAGREFKFYLSFLSSHDESAPFAVQLSTVCTVCNNTFRANLEDTNGKALRIRIPHTKNMMTKLSDVSGIVDSFFLTAQRFAEGMNALALIPISTDNARAFFAGFTMTADNGDDSPKTAKACDEISTRRENQIDRLTELFLTGKGNKGQNHADLFSAITDYYSHESSTKGEDDASKLRQETSSEFGNGQTMKALAWRVLADDTRTALTIAQGAKLLAASASAKANASK